jgi:predicted small integral membrane protein
MTTETNSTKQDNQGRKRNYNASASQPVYGLGFIGALVYYISHATTFWLGVVGFFKAIFWPAMLVYEMLKYLEM